MLSLPARFAVTALVLALAAAVVAPAEAEKGASAPASDVYAPTGETIDTTIVVTAARI